MLYGNCLQCLKQVLMSDIARLLGMYLVQQQFSGTIQLAKPIESVAAASMLPINKINKVALKPPQRKDATPFTVLPTPTRAA
jgi:hypothetical protein